MAEKNEREIIQCFEEIAKYDLPSETVERHIEDVRKRLTEQSAGRSMPSTSEQSEKAPGEYSRPDHGQAWQRRRSLS